VSNPRRIALSVAARVRRDPDAADQFLAELSRQDLELLAHALAALVPEDERYQTRPTPRAVDPTVERRRVLTAALAPRRRTS